MRNMLLATAAAGVLAASPASAQVYGNSYDAPGVYEGPGAIVVQPPPMVESQVYLAPNTTYAVPVAPGQQYVDTPIVIDGQRYYRDCWWDWGTRRCELKPWW